MPRQLVIQLKKELFESARKKRLLILAIVFVAAGIMSPTLAKLMPEIMKTALPEGMNVQLPAPTSVDAWTQFFKNSLQFGLLALVLLYADTLCGEVTAGTLINLLTKGLDRRWVVLGKALQLFLLWTAGFWLSFAVSWGYTRYFFDDAPAGSLFFSCLALWLYGSLFLSFLMTASAIAASGLQSLLLMALLLGLTMLLGIFKRIQRFDPFTLGSRNLEWLTGSAQLADSWPAFVLALVLLGGALVSAVMLFQRRLL